MATSSRIFILADDKSNWYPKRALTEFAKYTSLEIVNDPFKADVIWLFSYYLNPVELLRYPRWLTRLLGLKPKKKKSIEGIPIVTTLHHLSPYKKHIWKQMIHELDSITDIWQVPSPVSKDMLEPHVKKPITILPYWVDTEVFKPLSFNDKASLGQKYGIPENCLVIGSFQRDTEADEISPKLEKGPDLLCDVLEALGREVFVVLSGQRRQYVEKRLAKQGIEYKNVGTVDYKTMNELYNLLDYYLVTSRVEGGPQAILESIASGTKIFSTPVGISNTLPSSLVLKTPNEFVAALRRPYPMRQEDLVDISRNFSCANVIKKYDEFFFKYLR